MLIFRLFNKATNKQVTKLLKQVRLLCITWRTKTFQFSADTERSTKKLNARWSKPFDLIRIVEGGGVGEGVQILVHMKFSYVVYFKRRIKN